MFHSFFLFLDSIERSLRERHALWFFGVGSSMALGTLFLVVMWQPTMAPIVRLLGAQALPAAALLRDAETPPRQDASENRGGALPPTAEASGVEVAGARIDPDAAVVTPPSVSLIGEPRITVAVGSAYTDDGALAEGGTGEALPLRVYVDDAPVDDVIVDTSREGVHVILYRYRGSEGAAEAMRTIVVE
ncbi:MAG: hypothetical protein RLZZ234_740 [Candidatus Parcubacteria bacterium]|jgi:hypothetical protein